MPHFRFSCYLQKAGNEPEFYQNKLGDYERKNGKKRYE